MANAWLLLPLQLGQVLPLGLIEALWSGIGILATLIVRLVPYRQIPISAQPSASAWA